MFDYAVNDMAFDISEFMRLFISSGVATLFEQGDPNVLVGRSGIELTYEVLDNCSFSYEPIEPIPHFERSVEYWAGWALAYYQWDKSMSFSSIDRIISIADICLLYEKYHEMDVRQFCDYMNETIRNRQPETNLKRLRNNLGLSQSQLAQESGVPVRTIQQYEQRQKNINKAQVEYLIMLSSALHCEIPALIERI